MGGESNNAQKQAERNEKARQAQITQSVNAINKVYDDPRREQEIGSFLDATRSFYGDTLQRQKLDNDRQLSFALARQGLTGGSRQVDANRLLGENYQRGVLESDRLAQSAAADLRNQDEQSRLNLTAMAQSGLDATTAQSQAASAMRNNLLSGQSTATAQSLGDVFGGMANIYKSSQEQAAERRGFNYGLGSLYQPAFGQGVK